MTTDPSTATQSSARHVLLVKAEEIIDYTRRDNVAERLVKRFGAAIGTGAVQAMRASAALR